MTYEEVLHNVFVAQIRANETLVKKNNTYNPGADKLAHWKEDSVGEINLDGQVQTLLGYADKHWRKLKAMSQHVDMYEFSEWTESLDDLCNYMRLLECLLIESKEVT